jgi:hypothetical protein
MYATQRDLGYLYIWTPHPPAFTMKVKKDDAWAEKLRKLESFYIFCIRPVLKHLT